MIILLPPSESKTPATQGEPLNLDTLAFPQLAHMRRQVLSTLIQASTGNDRYERLHVSPRLSAELDRNITLETAPTQPAINTYTGVLYSALDAATLTHPERLTSVYVTSALFGMVGARDHIPAYRLSMSTPLFDTPLATLWKPHLTRACDGPWSAEVVLDCRSTDYRRAWPGHPGSTIVTKVVTETNGVRKVVSHNAKHTRGLLVRHLLNRASPDSTSPQLTSPQLTSIDDVAHALAEAFTVELTPASSTKPAELTVVV